MGLNNTLQLESLASLLPKILIGTIGHIYLQGDYPWTEESLGLLYYSDGYSENPLEEDAPDFVIANNLQVVMTIARAEDALRNAYQQKSLKRQSLPTLGEAVACFNFHYKNSGYLELG